MQKQLLLFVPDININIVECKSIRDTVKDGMDKDININIVECKSTEIDSKSEPLAYKYKHSGM